MLWNLYQLATDYANKLCHKKCYDIVDECQEYILEHISRNDMAKLQSFKYLSSESTFAYVVVNNLIKDFLKTKKSVISFDEMTNHSFSTTVEKFSETEENIIKNDEKETVEITLKTLKMEDQLIIKLRYYDEYQVYEIAQLLNKTPKQISKKIEMIKKRLKKILKREDFSF